MIVESGGDEGEPVLGRNGRVNCAVGGSGEAGGIEPREGRDVGGCTAAKVERCGWRHGWTISPTIGIDRITDLAVLI